MKTPDTPLFVKTHDFILWLIRHTQRFPKNLRHTYTQKVENAAFEFQEQVQHAAERVDELGRLLGAWRKGTNRTAPASTA